ncbi:MAG TPA: FtsX-like permease family protein [Kofleriaceae bacterium]
MASARWRKLRGDLGAMPGRVAAMIVALAVSLVGFGSVLGARTVLRREIAASYLSSHPADATIELDGDVDRAVVAQVRARPEVAEAEARGAVMARIQPDAPPALLAHGPHGGPGMAATSRPLQLFVVDDFAALRLARFRRESGAWPPPTGTLLIERSAVGLLGAGEHDRVTVKTPHGEPRPVTISGIVHDTGLAPAWQERTGYGYVTRDTLAALGEPPVLHELRVSFRPAPATRAEAEAAAAALAGWLAASGHPVHQVRVPPLRQHPHQAQMDTAQIALLLFSALLLVLSAVLVATLFSAMLARQVREIGVMKALGARTAQLARLYAVAIVVIGAAAGVVALPLAALGAHAMIDALAGMMNLAVDDAAIPAWVFAAQLSAGIAVPLAIAAVPIQRACRLTVRAALAQYGARDRPRLSLVRLPMAARDALRQPVRLALTLALLTTGGVLATAAFNVKRAYEVNVERMPAMWHHDLDLRLREPAPVEVAAALAQVPGVRIAEPWGLAIAAFPRAGVDVARTYPDQGHGAFPVWGVPLPSRLVDLPVVAGRWLVPGDDAAIVVSTTTGRRVGESLTVSLDGAPSTWTVVGVVDILPAGGGFVSDAAFARAAHAEGKARTIRIATTATSDHELRAILAGVEHELARQGAHLEGVVPFAMLRDAIDAHVLILVRASLLLSGIIVLVGLLGLAAAIGIGVIARTREIGMMKSVGATNGRIFRLVIGEAVLVGAASWVATAILTLPVTAAIDDFLTRQGFLSAHFVVSPAAIAGWLAIVTLGSALAAVMPARRAARLTVRQALMET